MPPNSLSDLAALLPSLVKKHGFAEFGISDIALDDYLARVESWLDRGYAGDMSWMRDRMALRSDPGLLLPETVRVISLRMNYLHDDTEPVKILHNPEKAYISRYALGRDYHKLIRNRLSKLANEINDWAKTQLDDPRLVQRAFVDSAPILEKPFAEKAGLGWIGKNTLLLNKSGGSWFFLGEILTNLDIPLETTAKQQDKCGSCRACIRACPTNAFPEPYVLDARKCVSYLTIEHKGAIPEEFRTPMGNRVFGCDDCQLVCPWTRYAKPTDERDFSPRHGLASADLLDLFAWTEEQFLQKTAGSPIRRVGYERWRRNLAVGIGNGPASSEAVTTLKHTRSASPLVKEHVDWALAKMRRSKVKKPKRAAARMPQTLMHRIAAKELSSARVDA